jgi:hypothetical protein
MDNSNVCLSDSSGNLQYYTNGAILFNKEHEELSGSEHYNPSTALPYLPDSYSWLMQGGVSFVSSYNPNKVCLFHTPEPNNTNPNPAQLYYSSIDLQQDSGRGVMVEKTVPIIINSQFFSQLFAVKHGNGKDWWIIVPEQHTNCYYRILFRNDSVLTPSKQCLGGIICGQPNVNDGDGAITVAFDEMGNATYIRLCENGKFYLYDFDRCRGVFSNFRELNNPTNQGAWGLAISPNGNILYISTGDMIFQVNLRDSIPAMSLVVTWNGHYYNIPSTSISVPIGLQRLMLAPNGKIYIGTGQTPYLGVIEHPNVLGVGCTVIQEAIELPRLLYLGSPNHPNYCLGAMPEPCAALPPLSTDESEVPTQNLIEVYPNPADKVLYIKSKDNPNSIKSVLIYNSLGQVMYQREIEEEVVRVNIQTYSVGVYHWQAISQAGKILSGKFIIER